MAFDRPLEADTVDDLNLLGVLSRAPVIGGLLWLLGGKQAQLEAERDRAIMMNGDDDEKRQSISPMNPMYARKPQKPALKKTSKHLPPGLIGSADLSECTMGLQELDLYGEDNESNDRKRKKLSWSDESGKSLQQVMESGQSVRFEPQAVDFQARDQPARTSSSAAPRSSFTKLGLTRSQSVRAQLEHPYDSTNNFLPRAIERPKKSAVASNQTALHHPYSMEARNSGSDDGLESPLWGWYVRTTPPTPEMHHARPPKKNMSTSSTASTASSSSSTAGNATESPPVSLPSSVNPIFQGLPSQKHARAMGFPSVPL